MKPATLFGAPLGYSPEDLSALLIQLDQLWFDFAQRTKSLLEVDLELMAKTFGAGASAKTLRATLAKLPAASPGIDRLPEQIALVAMDRVLITPEGRILIDVLEAMQASGRLVIHDDLALEALDRSVVTRGDWYRSWLAKQINGNLSAPAIGAAVFLLINGSIEPAGSLAIPADETAEQDLAAVVLPVVSAFSQALGSSTPETDSGLRSHWAFTQVTRLLPLDVARVKSGDGGAEIFVRAGREDHLIADLAGRLARRDAGQVAIALEAMVTSYRRVRGDLLALGVSREEPTHTRAVIRRLTPQIRAF